MLTKIFEMPRATLNSGLWGNVMAFCYLASLSCSSETNEVCNGSHTQNLNFFKTVQRPIYVV